MRRNLFLGLILTILSLSLGFRNAEASCTVPNELTNGQTADASQVMANFNSVLSCVNNAPAGSTNALQYNAGTGTFGGVGPLTNGQIVIGSTGSAPQASTITAGTGIAVTNGPGSITISSSTTPAQSAFRVYLSTSQGTSASTPTTIIFQTKQFDLLNEYNTATGAFIPVNSGYYMFTAAVLDSQASQRTVYMNLYVDGSAYCIMYQQTMLGFTNDNVGVSGLVYLTAGQAVTLNFYSNLADSALAGQATTYFAGYRVY